MEKSKDNISRRSFLGRSAAAVICTGIGIKSLASRLHGAVSGGEVEAGTNQETPHIKDYRELGSTGWKVSDISFGNAGMKDPTTLEYAIERGINYVDTARQYYDMEKVIGQIFPQKRDKVFVTTKLLPNLFTADAKEETFLQAIDESLKRLNTDHIDGCLIHSVGEDPKKADRTIIKNDNIYSAFRKAKKDGKIRFWGASTHGPLMIEELTWLLENTEIDIIHAGMNYLTRGLEPVLAAAKEKGVAVVAMKTLSAARKVDFSEFKGKGRTLRQALIKWMLTQPNIDSLAITMRTIEEIDEYVSASGNPRLNPDEEKTLKTYGKMESPHYCRPGCSYCLESCPHHLPINDILRYKLYFENYGNEKYAMSMYSKLPPSRRATLCQSCSGICESSCPFHVRIRSKMLESHSELTL